MKKRSTIIFRIPETLDSYINTIVEKNKDIKNRSDFGMKAIKYYLEKEYSILFDEDFADNQDNKELIVRPKVY